jgi:hypothetical protein
MIFSSSDIGGGRAISGRNGFGVVLKCAVNAIASTSTPTDSQSFTDVPSNHRIVISHDCDDFADKLIDMSEDLSMPSSLTSSACTTPKPFLPDIALPPPISEDENIMSQL